MPEEKKYLVTSESCPHCVAVKGRLKKFLKSGEIEELFIKTEEDVKLATEIGIHAVPQLMKCRIDDKKMECEPMDVYKFIEEED